MGLVYFGGGGTVAADMTGQVDRHTKQERNRIMTYKSNQTRQKVYEDYIGFTEQALLEQKTPDGYFTAYTKRYIPVLVKDEGFTSGDIVNITLTGIERDKMSCEIIK